MGRNNRRPRPQRQKRDYIHPLDINELAFCPRSRRSSRCLFVKSPPGPFVQSTDPATDGVPRAAEFVGYAYKTEPDAACRAWVGI